MSEKLPCYHSNLFSAWLLELSFVAGNFLSLNTLASSFYCPPLLPEGMLGFDLLGSDLLGSDLMTIIGFDNSRAASICWLALLSSLLSMIEETSLGLSELMGSIRAPFR